MTNQIWEIISIKSHSSFNLLCKATLLFSHNWNCHLKFKSPIIFSVLIFSEVSQLSMWKHDHSLNVFCIQEQYLLVDYVPNVMHDSREPHNHDKNRSVKTRDHKHQHFISVLTLKQKGQVYYWILWVYNMAAVLVQITVYRFNYFWCKCELLCLIDFIICRVHLFIYESSMFWFHS